MSTATFTEALGLGFGELVQKWQQEAVVEEESTLHPQ